MSWHTIRAPAHAHPNVQEGREVIPGGPSEAWIRDVRGEYGEDSPYYTARVEARFPAASTDGLVQEGWVERAMEWHRTGNLDFHAEGEPWTVGVDVARFGSDSTVAAIRRGSVVYELRRWGQSDTMQTVSRITELWEELHEDGRAHVETVAVDSVGMGAGVLDRLKETHITRPRKAVRTRTGRVRRRSTSVEGFDARKSALVSERFHNLRSQAWWRVRDLLEEGDLLLPEDAELAEELSRAPYRLDGKGRTWVQKDDLRDRIGRSSDKADAVAISMLSGLESDEGFKLRWG